MLRSLDNDHVLDRDSITVFAVHVPMLLMEDVATAEQVKDTNNTLVHCLQTK